MSLSARETGPADERSPMATRAVTAGSVLVGTVLALVVGALLHASGSARAAGWSWAAGGVLGLAYAAVAVTTALAARHMGVDVIALLALIGALVVREFLAASVISAMLASGRVLEAWAEGRARRDLRALVERMPRRARRRRGDELEMVEVDAITPGDVLVVATGEIVPVDGRVVSAESLFDESTLSGEPMPVLHRRGDPICSGVANVSTAVEITATAAAGDSTYAGLVRLVREAEGAPARFIRAADRFALWFLAGVLVMGGAAWVFAGLPRAVAVLVVATPCPLILAAPVAFVGGSSLASRRAIMVKGAAVLERLANCSTLLIDKTGTVTTGIPVLDQVFTAEHVSADDILRLAASLEQMSPHVLAPAIVEAARRRGCPLEVPTGLAETTGRGIEGMVAGRRVRVGSGTWVGIAPGENWVRAARRSAWLTGAMSVFVSVDGRPVAALILADPVRQDARRTITSLRREGIRRVVMVTGDKPAVAETVGAVIGADEVLAERTPAEKMDAVRSERSLGPVVMVGDGINDAPALALADVGVAMGSRGATASSDAADVVLTVNRLDRIGTAMRIARRTRRIATESVVTGIGLSMVAMGVAVAGFLPAVWGAIYQEVIDVAVIINALRTLRLPEDAPRADQPTQALLERFRKEHHDIDDLLASVLSTADALESMDRDEIGSQVRSLYESLLARLGPHEEQEERELFPALDRLLGNEGVTGTMSRAHVEIHHRIRMVGRMLEELEDGDSTPALLIDLRRALYGLHAIVELHNRQEEESFFSLAAPDETEGQGVIGTHITECRPAGSGSKSAW